MEKTKLNRQVFDKSKFGNTVDTSFSELGNINQPDPSFFDSSLAGIEDFFTIYENIFYEIPKNGDVNTHEYLVKKSSEYIGFQQNQTDIQALLDEIADLREQNLELRQENTDLLIRLAESSTQSVKLRPFVWVIHPLLY